VRGLVGGLLLLTLMSMAALMMCVSALASPPRYELVKKFGPDGSELSGFVSAGPVAVDQQSHLVYAVDGHLSSSGRMYQFDSDGNPVDWSGSAPYISGNEISGLEVLQEGRVQVGVDSTTHTIYVTSANSVRAFQANGEPSNFTAGPFSGSSSIGDFGELTGLAVDADGYIYASDRTAGAVKIFAPSGEPVTQFAVENPVNLAVDSNGSVYVTRLSDVEQPSTVVKVTPSPASLPVTGATSYTPASGPVDPVPSFSVGVNPATNDVYVVHSLDHPGVAVYDEAGNPVTTFGEPGSAGELYESDGIAIDGTDTRVFAGNNPTSGGGLSQVEMFQPEPAAAPRIEVSAVGGVSNTAATLYARINPNQKATTYRFEYGLSDCATSVCTTVPIGGASIDAGNDGVWVAQKIQGLNPSTEYHYRVIAENELGLDEAAGVFSTQSTNFAFGLSDSRAWEMVSPPNKRGALLRGTENAGGLIQAAADGNGLAYISTAPIEAEPEGSRAVEPSSVLARRSPSGWVSDELTPPNAQVTPIPVGELGEYKLFSSDLSKAVLDPRSGTALSEEASERAPYLRENTKPPVYRPLVTGKEGFANVPPGTEFGGVGPTEKVSAVTIQDASPDLSHVVLYSKVPLVAGAPATGNTIYEWADGQLSALSVLPASEGGGIIAATSGSGQVSMHHAISDDGSRVFWTGDSVPPETANKKLYVRDVGAGETARLDEVQSGATGEGEVQPIFQGASADGTVVYFTDTQQLTADASPAGKDLYRCEIVEVAAGCINLIDLTAPQGGSGESGKMQGIVAGLSENGSRVYFVAKGALAAEENRFGQDAVAGQPNLYLWEKDKGLRFIAMLAAEDRPDWGLPGTFSEPGVGSGSSSAGSPSGRYLAFMSERDLTAQGNIDVTSGEAVERVFRFDADAGRLDCVSCPPGGAAPQGTLVEEDELVDPRRDWFGRQVAAILPEPEILHIAGPTIYQPRVVLDNGRVLFNAIDSLVAADSNKQWDVYQYEDLGVGDCSGISGNAAIRRSGGGCVSLISSGTGETETGFLDASTTGNDVFFLTSARLSVTDVDKELDVYDARVDGVPAVLSLKEECASSESCHPASPQVQGVAPGSTSFNGPGNVKPSRKCPKGKHRVTRGHKQRCVPRKGKRHGKKHHRRAGQRKGASR
jgi:hypothetical protein